MRVELNIKRKRAPAELRKTDSFAFYLCAPRVKPATAFPPSSPTASPSRSFSRGPRARAGCTCAARPRVKKRVPASASLAAGVWPRPAALRQSARLCRGPCGLFPATNHFAPAVDSFSGREIRGCGGSSASPRHLAYCTSADAAYQPIQTCALRAVRAPRRVPPTTTGRRHPPTPSP